MFFDSPSDVISIGDATLDVFLQISEAEVKCDKDSEKCQLCFSYADKIPVDHLEKVEGAGNASNNAVGASRLGMKASIVSILGDDDIGRNILKHWKQEGLDTRHVQIDKGRCTNYSTVLNYDSERTILVYHEPRHYTLPFGLRKAKWLYLTALGEGSESMHPDIINYVDESGVKLIFQPGTYHMKLGRGRLEPLIAISEIIAVNKQEAQRIVNNDSKDMKHLLNDLHKIGAKIVLITDGPGGSYTYDGAKYLKLGIFDAPVVERTGVGDAFTVAFMAALHFGKTIGEAMRWGSANSTSVISSIGPQHGLLNRPALEHMLTRYEHMQPEEF
jgi:sugar/nucleoside kinase (ribokinase family)